MTLDIVLRYLHFLFVFAIVGTLVSEHLLLKKQLTRGEIARLARIDAVYGAAAIGLLAVGLILWLGGVGKPTLFYSKNWIFHVKLTLFLFIGLASIYPTVFFIKNRKGPPEEVITTPSLVTGLLRFELLLLVVIPLLAGLMARGVGYFG